MNKRPNCSLLCNTCSSWFLLFLRSVFATLPSWLCWVRGVNIHLSWLLLLHMCVLGVSTLLSFTLFLPTDSRWLLFCCFMVLLLLLVICVISWKRNDYNLVSVNPTECAGFGQFCVCTVKRGTYRGFLLTLYFLLPSKGGSQRLTGGAKHPVSPGVPVPDAVPSVGEVLDPVSGQGQLSRVITVTGVGVPVEVIEGTLQHTKEAIHIPHYKFWSIHWWVPQDPRDNVICCAHARLFVHFWERMRHKESVKTDECKEHHQNQMTWETRYIWSDLLPRILALLLCSFSCVFPSFLVCHLDQEIQPLNRLLMGH